MIVRERRVLAATVACAIGAPVAAAAWVGARTGELTGALAQAAGQPARIDAIDADLTGAVRLTGVAIGELFAADAVEAAAGMGSLLDGSPRADELRVIGPRLTVRVDPDGDSDLARLARRLAHRAGAGRPAAGAATSGAGRPLRRIVVAGGRLTAQIAGVGELAADAVELIPDGDRLRVVTGRIDVHGRARGLAVALSFARGAAELSLPRMRLGRVLAVGGAGTLTGAGGGPPRGDLAGGALALRELAAGRRDAAGALELRGVIDDAGVPRALAADLVASPAGLTIAVRGERVPLRALAGLVPRGLDVTAARATGALIIQRRAPAGAGAAWTTELSADAAIDQLAIDHPRFAPAPVALALGVRAELTISPAAVTVARAGLALGAIRITGAGWVRRGGPLAGQLELELEPAPCAELLAALPERVRGPLDGMALEGSFGARARLAVDLAAPPGDGVQLDHQLASSCRTLAEPPAADVTALAGAGADERAEPPAEPSGAGRVELRSLPGHVAAAFISAEDGRFWDHDGFDFEQIARSLEIDLREHRLARGGSTISQQLVKNALLSQRRTVDRKIQEAVLTWRIEARLDKREILERYLDIIELGPRVTGLGAAARYWFAAAPHELSLRQAAFLAALTSQPSSMSRRVRRAGGLDPDSAERVQVVLRAMRRDGAITGEAYEAARTAPLRFATSAVAHER